MATLLGALCPLLLQAVLTLDMFAVVRIWVGLFTAQQWSVFRVTWFYRTRSAFVFILRHHRRNSQASHLLCLPQCFPAAQVTLLPDRVQTWVQVVFTWWQWSWQVATGSVLWWATWSTWQLSHDQFLHLHFCHLAVALFQGDVQSLQFFRCSVSD